MFNWNEYETVQQMVNDPHEELCLTDARAEYLFDIYDAIHAMPFSEAVENSMVDWDSLNRIDCFIIDRFCELGRRDYRTDGELASRDIRNFRCDGPNLLTYKSGGIESSVTLDGDRWVAEERNSCGVFSRGYGTNAQHALSDMRLVVPRKMSAYTVKFCMNGDMNHIDHEARFTSKDLYEMFIDGLPYDFIDADDTTTWVDFGDE